MERHAKHAFKSKVSNRSVELYNVLVFTFICFFFSTFLKFWISCQHFKIRFLIKIWFLMFTRNT